MLFCEKKKKQKKKCSLILISSKYSSVRLVSYLLSLEDCFSTDIGFHIDTNCPRGPRDRGRVVVGFTKNNICDFLKKVFISTLAILYYETI
jgi:hypothetical protein